MIDYLILKFSGEVSRSWGLGSPQQRGSIETTRLMSSLVRGQEKRNPGRRPRRNSQGNRRNQENEVSWKPRGVCRRRKCSATSNTARKF